MLNDEDFPILRVGDEVKHVRHDRIGYVTKQREVLFGLVAVRWVGEEGSYLVSRRNVTITKRKKPTKPEKRIIPKQEEKGRFEMSTADLVIEGVLCQNCGGITDEVDRGEEPNGFPTSCGDCKKDGRADDV